MVTPIRTLSPGAPSAAGTGCFNAVSSFCPCLLSPRWVAPALLRPRWRRSQAAANQPDMRPFSASARVAPAVSVGGERAGPLKVTEPLDKCESGEKTAAGSRVSGIVCATNTLFYTGWEFQQPVCLAC